MDSNKMQKDFPNSIVIENSIDIPIFVYLIFIPLIVPFYIIEKNNIITPIIVTIIVIIFVGLLYYFNTYKYYRKIEIVGDKIFFSKYNDKVKTFTLSNLLYLEYYEMKYCKFVFNNDSILMNIVLENKHLIILKESIQKIIGKKDYKLRIYKGLFHKYNEI